VLDQPFDRRRWCAEAGAQRTPLRVDGDDRLVLLGTGGGSNPKANRCGFSNAIVIGDAAYLIDAGEGVHRQLWRAGLTATTRWGGDRPVVRAIFVTHLHADHIMDLPNIMQGSWPSQPIEVYGPGPGGAPYTTYDDPVHPVRFPDDPAPGIRRTMGYFDHAFGVNVNSRLIAEQRSDYIDQLRIHEIGLAGETEHPDDIAVPVEVGRPGLRFTVPEMEPFVVRPEDDRGVTVTAVLVQHAPVFPALAYRFETPVGSVVFSGDTGPCENVVRLAHSADYLVHEVIDLEPLLKRFIHMPNYESVEYQLSTTHTPVGSVGAIAERAGVGTLVLSHLVPGEDGHTPEEWERLAQPGFSGRVVCAVDLDELPLPIERSTDGRP
jgi:ribonuclease BN (tRNA processing enzyme)